MSTATTYGPITVSEVPDLEPAAGELGDATFFDPIPELDALDHPHPALFAWDAFMEEVRAEVAPQIAQLVTDAARRRLPWTWEPER